MKVVLLASGDLGILTLEALLQRRDIEVVSLVPGDTSIVSYAAARNLRILKSDDINSESFLSQLRELQPDLLVNVIFLQRYRSKILEIPRYGAVNLHPSKLPSYRGRDCIRWAMINGEKEIGVTVHQIDANLDTGDILLQETFEIDQEENYFQVRERMKPYYPRLVLQTIEHLKEGKIDRIKQCQNSGTYFPHRAPEDSRIDWFQPSLDIHNLVRASYEPGFYAYTFLRSQKIFITKTSLGPSADYRMFTSGRAQRCGRVLDFNGDSGMLVGTADGVILVEKCGLEQAISGRARSVLKRGDKFA